MNCTQCSREIPKNRCEGCGQKLRAQGFPLPPNLTLPFFAYGVFKPGELAFLRIKEFVQAVSEATVPGAWKMRDGLPIAVLGQSQVIRGCLMRFESGLEHRAYQHIADLEPDKQYQWGELYCNGEKVNILVGVKPEKGAQEMDVPWSGRKDPLFTSALDVVEETLVQAPQNMDGMDDLRPLFRLEMAYLLLWTSIERYASLRYSLGGDRAHEKVIQIATEPAFAEALRENVQEIRSVQRADKPDEKCTLDRDVPNKSLAYYYQIRSNLVHRGKGVFKDYERVRKSLMELLEIFKFTLRAAFEESGHPSN